MSEFKSPHIDLDLQCDVVVLIAGVPEFTMQFAGVRASELNVDGGRTIDLLVAAALRRRGCVASFDAGIAHSVPLFGRSGRPRA